MADRPTNLRYAYEKFSAAVHTLATGPGRINERLLYAYLAMVALSPEDFPAGDLRTDYQRLYAALTPKEAKRDEGKVKATLDEMGEDDAVELAELICDMEYRIGEAP